MYQEGSFSNIEVNLLKQLFMILVTDWTVN